MTDREKYKKTFSALQPERDYLEKINNTGVIKMNDIGGGCKLYIH